MSRLKPTLLVLCLLGLPSTVLAKPDCTEAKDLIGVVKTFYQADEDVKNIISPTFKMVIKGQGEHPDPDGIRYIFEEEVIDLAVSNEGEVLGLEQAVDFDKNGKLCKLIDGKLVDESGEDTASANMSFVFPFKTLEGEHNFDELKEGAKDGSKVMKGLAPSGLGFVVPGLKSIMIKPAEKNGVQPVLTFVKKGETVEGPEISSIGPVQMFKLKDMKKMKADKIRISGDYVMEANFNYDDEDIERANAKLAEAPKEEADDKEKAE